MRPTAPIASPPALNSLFNFDDAALGAMLDERTARRKWRSPIGVREHASTARRRFRVDRSSRNC